MKNKDITILLIKENIKLLWWGWSTAWGIAGAIIGVIKII